MGPGALKKREAGRTISWCRVPARPGRSSPTALRINCTDKEHNTRHSGWLVGVKSKTLACK